jgi:indole-3-glycerol phosphate synthase
VDINKTILLKKLLPKDLLLISESGISKRKEIDLLKQNNINGILIGEHLMRSDDLDNDLLQLKQWCKIES